RPVPALAGADARAQAPGGVPGRAVRAAPLAPRDPAGLSRRGLLRAPRLRRAGRRRDLLLAPGEPAHHAAGGAARGPPAGALGVRPAQPPGGGAPAPA